MHTLSFSAVFCQKGPHSRDGTTTLLAPASLINHPCWELGAVSNTGPEGYAQLWPVHLHPRSANPKLQSHRRLCTLPCLCPSGGLPALVRPLQVPKRVRSHADFSFIASLTLTLPSTIYQVETTTGQQCVVCVSPQSCPTLCDPLDCSLPGSPSMGSPRQGYWRGLSLPSLLWNAISQKDQTTIYQSLREGTRTMNFQMFNLDLEKAEEPEIKLPTSIRSLKKQQSSRKPSISALLTMPKPLTVDHNKLWKILKEMGIPDHLTCLLRSLYASQEATVRTGHETTDWFQIRKGVQQGCIVSPCLFNVYAKYIMRNAGWMKHKLESRLQGEISITLDMQMTPPLWQKAKKN